MQLMLDSFFNPFPEQQKISFERFTFPGGEPHIKLLETIKEEEVTISHRIRSFNDMGVLLCAVNALRNVGVRKIHLYLPYFPAARQDRIMVEGEALTVKIYADLINALDLESISVFDPHSDVAPALLNRCKVITNHLFVKKVVDTLNEKMVLISPDGGALKKVYKLAAFLEDYEVVECSKSRNIATGKLNGFKVNTDDLQGQNCLIVDDICDGGGTFLGLAKELKAKNAGKLYLAISHGIFSKGLEELSQYFETIFTTNSFKDIEHEKLVQFELDNLFNKK